MRCGDFDRQRIGDAGVGDRHHPHLVAYTAVVLCQLDRERLGSPAVVPCDEVEDPGHRPGFWHVA